MTDILSHVAEENQRRVLKVVPDCVRLQCLRCRSEFTPHDGAGREGGRRRTGAVMLPEGEDELDGVVDGNKGESDEQIFIFM